MKNYNEYIKLLESTKVKYYEPILPKGSKKEFIDILIKDFEKQLKNDPKFAMYIHDKPVTDVEEIRKFFNSDDINNITHEVIHIKQQEKYPKMFGYLLKQAQKDWDELEKNNNITKNMRGYLSNPPEIMAYAFSYIYITKKKIGEDMYGKIDDIYKQIGGEVYDVFKKYVDFYEQNI